MAHDEGMAGICPCVAARKIHRRVAATACAKNRGGDGARSAGDAARLRKIAMFNLRLAFPDWTDARRNETLHQMTRYLAWQAVEFARFPKYNRANIERVIEIEGHENFLEAQRKGKGVLILTGHIGAWELSSFAHAVYGFSMHYLARPLDNARLDAFVNRYRGLSGISLFTRMNRRGGVEDAAWRRNCRGTRRPEHTAGRRRVRRVLRQNRLHDNGHRAPGFAHGAAVVPGYAYWTLLLRNTN